MLIVITEQRLKRVKNENEIRKSFQRSERLRAIYTSHEIDCRSGPSD